MKRSGHPRLHKTDENVEKVRNLVHSDGRLNIGAMAVRLYSEKTKNEKVLND
jgi:hypothetical protein